MYFSCICLFVLFILVFVFFLLLLVSGVGCVFNFGIPWTFAVCFLWLSLPGHYRVTDEALLAETT